MNQRVQGHAYQKSAITPPPPFKLGLDALLENCPDWLENRRVGLVSHAAAVDARGVTSAEKLHRVEGMQLTSLFGPEHGFAGLAAAGELTQDESHAVWGIPIYSLYGETRKPTRVMLDNVDTLIVEFQDLGARPYTYVSTLRLILEAAAETGKTVIVADRPVPLPLSIDGPLLDPAFETFVGLIPGPMQYGMTPGETARWLVEALGLPLDLRVSPMQGYFREGVRQPAWPEWIPPSPRIRSWESACLFTSTVFGEALPALDYGSTTPHSFQIIGAPWLDAKRLLEELNKAPLPGIRFEPIRYVAMTGLHKGIHLDGLRLVITDYGTFRSVSTAVTLLARIQTLYGASSLWDAPGTRLEWFDKLFGTDTVRRSLQANTPAPEIIASWQPALDRFKATKNRHLLYTPPTLNPEPLIILHETPQKSHCPGRRIRGAISSVDPDEAQTAFPALGKTGPRAYSRSPQKLGSAGCARQRPPPCRADSGVSPDRPCSRPPLPAFLRTGYPRNWWRTSQGPLVP